MFQHHKTISPFYVGSLVSKWTLVRVDTFYYGFMKHKLTLIAQERKRERAGLLSASPPNVQKMPADGSELTSVSQRICQIIGIVQNKNRSASNMIFFVLYDIASNKVRTLVAKYLEGKGCTRIQRSVFLADLPAEQFERIKSDLAEVQAAYQNADSILIIPISAGYLDAMKVIGQEVNVDLITHTRNTLFF